MNERLIMQFCVANKVLPSAEGFGSTFIFGSRLWFCLSCKRFQKNTGNPKDKCQDMLAWSCCWAATGCVVKAFMITKLTDTTVDRYRRWCFFMPTWVIMMWQQNVLLCFELAYWITFQKVRVVLQFPLIVPPNRGGGSVAVLSVEAVSGKMCGNGWLANTFDYNQRTSSFLMLVITVFYSVKSSCSAIQSDFHSLSPIGVWL